MPSSVFDRFRIPGRDAFGEDLDADHLLRPDVTRSKADESRNIPQFTPTQNVRMMSNRTRVDQDMVDAMLNTV